MPNQPAHNHIADNNLCMTVPTVLFHYGTFEPLWQQPGMIQAGPLINEGAEALKVVNPSVPILLKLLDQRGWCKKGVLLHYSDPFIMKRYPLLGVDAWPGPRLLACGDLHHGPKPIETLAAYCLKEIHHAVLLTFNPALIKEVRLQLKIPVRCLSPTFFRYPNAERASRPTLKLLHIGNLGSNHMKRKKIVKALISRSRVPFLHLTTSSSIEAASLYSQYALILNIPLNQDLNHRFFEVIAAGAPQIVFGSKDLLGNNATLTKRKDIFWASSIEEIESITLELFKKPQQLLDIFIEPPQYWELQALIKAGLSP